VGATVPSDGASSAPAEPLPDSLAAAADLAAALAALHREGRVHGRIHAGCLTCAGPGAQLGELSARARPLPAVEGDLAALACAAPEVLRGHPASRASDVHALAIVVADLVAGRVAETPASLVEAVHRGLHRPPLAVRGSVPPRVARLLRRATSRRRWCRPSAATLAAALRDASSARARVRRSPLPAPERDLPEVAPAPARPMEAPPPPARSLRPLASALPIAVPRRRVALAGAAALAVVVAGVAVMFVHRAGALERGVSARLAARDVEGAWRLLREAEGAGETGSVLDKLRGDVACAARAYGECVRRYDAALASRPALGRDPRLRENALSLASRSEERRAVVAVLARVPGLEGELLEMTHSPRYWTRWNAVRALEARGARDRMDFARVYALDLLHAGSCETRRAAAEKLTALRDPRLVPDLTRAYEAARSSWSEWRCTGPEVQEALRAARRARVAAR